MDLLQQLEIKHPIFLAPMAGVSTLNLQQKFLIRVVLDP